MHQQLKRTQANCWKIAFIQTALL